MLTRLGLRAFTSGAIRVIHNVAKQQFMISCPNGEVAVLDYCREDQTNITLLHTDVPEVCQGKGFGKKLAEAAFRYAYEQHLTVVVKCSYLSKFYADNYTKYPSLPVRVDLS